MLRNCIGSVRHKSIFSKVEIIPFPITHDFHKVIKWVKPDYLHPWHPQRSCDLQQLPKVDPTWLKMEYRPFADSINQLPEEQRKIFTVEYGRRKDGINVIRDDITGTCKQHLFDHKSLQFKIAHSTVKIRNFQDQLNTFQAVRRSGWHRQKVKEMIEKRKKWMRQLRIKDYKCFEWIIELLGVIYKPDAPKVLIQRRASLNLLVNMYCNEVREKKMNAYKQLLETEKIPFLESKLETLQQIKMDEESIQIECSVEEDIQETKSLLEKLKSRKDPMTIHPVQQGSNLKQIQGGDSLSC